MYSRITSNVTNFRVNITKIERSRKKHYETMFVAGRSLKNITKNVHVDVLTPPAHGTGITMIPFKHQSILMNKKFIQGLQISPCSPYWFKALVNHFFSHNFKHTVAQDQSDNLGSTRGATWCFWRCGGLRTGAVLVAPVRIS
jgi:hypothetical protein